MTNVERFVREYLEGDPMAVYKIAAAYRVTAARFLPLFRGDRSIEEEDLFSEVFLSVWAALKKGVRHPGVLYQRLQWDLMSLLRDVRRWERVRLPLDESVVETLRFAVDDDEELLLLRMQLDICLKRLKRRSAPVGRVAHLLAEGWSRQDVAERVGRSSTYVSRIITEHIYPEFWRSFHVA